MKTIRIAKTGVSSTIYYACDELCTYLKLMDAGCMTECRSYQSFDSDVEGVIWVGEGIATLLSDDDTVYIDISDGCGVISGSNPRSVLIAVYRFLYEMGCRFYRYGDPSSDRREYEYIPTTDFEKSRVEVHVSEKASYRHRSICIEGAVSYEHVKSVINWLPKVGMNGYYVQFKVPHTFFNAWSQKHDKALSRDDVTAIYDKLREDIKLRGLSLHAVGHGWTCEPLGYDGSGWYEAECNLPDDKRQYLAEIGGKRDFNKAVPLNTNLCYSNPEVRELITDAIADYCAENPCVDYLHFWLADSKNAQCECDECRKARPADYYVMMLNDIDRKLTERGIKTKIVFLIYYDLLWKPLVEKIKNSDRFVLMFAPITRTYSASFTDSDMAAVPAPPEYERNNFTLSRSVNDSLAFLKDWQTVFDGDSFDFDYHMMWDHVRDIGYCECARILHRDMCNLDRIGLDGMVSCQVQRAAFPSNLPMYAMARGLWDKSSDFEAVADEYFTAEYGEWGGVVKKYLFDLSRMVNLPYFRRELPSDSPDLHDSYVAAAEYVQDFANSFIKKQPASQAMEYLAHHAKISGLILTALAYKCTGDYDSVDKTVKELEKYVTEHEYQLHRVLDVPNFIYVVKASLRP